MQPSFSFGILSPVDTLFRTHYEARKKSARRAYLWFFLLGSLGVHRFYLARPVSGAALLVLSVTNLAARLAQITSGGLPEPTLFGGTDLLTVAAALWMLLDAFRIPGMVRSYNERLLASLKSILMETPD